MLVSTVEALVSAGITDPYEFYEYVHVSDVGNTSGGGLGGAKALSGVFHGRRMGLNVQSDILQEVFINTMPAWVNMLLLSSSGPIKTPVGACATAAESVEIGVDTILSGKAKVVIIGAADDFTEEGSYEFASMQATNNSEQDTANGRKPAEHSRPMTTTRNGFVEAQGAGVQILMSADLAIKMGVPIYAVVALTNTATDKEGRSVPAPGQGILTTGKEKRENGQVSPLLDLEYRRTQLNFGREQIAQWKERELAALRSQGEAILQEKGHEAADHFLNSRIKFVNREALRMEKSQLQLWGHDFYRNDPSIAPLRGALSVFGLTPDDVGLASMHGTSTKANDRNEPEVLQKKMAHLGRTKGNVIPLVCQKWLTGHPKGPAAAWMLNGVVQAMNSGIIPGNRNADNITPELRPFTYVAVLDRAIRVPHIDAALLTSFGFGQAGGEVLVVNRDYALAALGPEQLEAYGARLAKREAAAYRYQHEVFGGKRPYVAVKTKAPYDDRDQDRVLLDPTARATYNPRQNTWAFVPSKHVDSTIPTSGAPLTKEQLAAVTAVAGKEVPSSAAKTSVAPTSTFGVSAKTRLEVAMREVVEGLRKPADRGIGVDIEEVNTFEAYAQANKDSEFFERNYTPSEIQYCDAIQEGRFSRYAGRWAAKEAVVKAITSASPQGPSLWKGSAAPLKDIEVLPTDSGAPVVILHGHAKEVATTAGITEVTVTISHAGAYAIAQATAR
mmetsp:Transcript_40375/g.65442  ORF Transcript_40375/g.65442 Transcript_40375/m.65442 type:complete len:728 (+) Transcript_40375:9792-11975(+)